MIPSSLNRNVPALRSRMRPLRALRLGRDHPVTFSAIFFTCSSIGIRLEREGELRRVTAEVDWDREIGAVTRRILEKKGPALLFEIVKGYRNGRCTKLFVSGLGARSRLALALGFPRDAANRELVQYVMKKNRETIAPVVVASGLVKEVIIRGEAIDQTEFPVPKWHYLEGGRYIHMFSCIVTRDPDTGVMNVGIYRGMIGRKDTAPFLLIKGGQHWGAHS
jgi:UbiD family decarboxylase